MEARVQLQFKFWSNTLKPPFLIFFFFLFSSDSLSTSSKTLDYQISGLGRVGRSVRIPVITKNISKISNSSGVFVFLYYSLKNTICIFIVDIQKSKLNFQYSLLEKKYCYAFASFSNIWKILHTSYSVRTQQHCFNITTILVIGFQIFWQSYNISKEYFYNIF